MSPRELAREAGVSSDILRHYERIGLVDPPPRTAAGYRQYPPATLVRVRLIQRALAVGFSLSELAAVLDERRRGGAPCRKVRALVGERLVELDRRLAELVQLKTDLTALLSEWDARLRRTPPGQPAHLLDLLVDHVRTPARRGRRQAGAAASNLTAASATRRRRPSGG